MVAQPSVTTLTTALAELTAGTDNIGQALTTLKHDIEGGDGTNPLAEMNYNTKILEGIYTQVIANFEQVKHVVGANLEMAKAIDKITFWIQQAEVDKQSYSKITAGVSEQLEYDRQDHHPR